MKVGALISGGKDSIFNILHCVSNSHEIVALLNLKPPIQTDELNSFMFQTVGSSVIPLISTCIDIPLVQMTIKGSSVSTGNEYIPNENDEVEDLFQLISQAKLKYDIEAVSVGAILSTYQRLRVEYICSRLNLKVLAFLWQQDQVKILNSIVECKFDVRIVKVAGMGLSKDLIMRKPLNESLVELLKDLSSKWGTHPAGEGGEFETIVLDCPLYKKKIDVKHFDVVTLTECRYAPVAFASNFEFELRSKEESLREITLVESINFLQKEFGFPLTYSTETFQNISTKSPTCPIVYRKSTKIIQKKYGKFSITSCISLSSISSSQDSIYETFEQEVSFVLDFILKNSTVDAFQRTILCMVYLKDINMFSRFNTVYSKYFPESHPSCRICIENKFDISHGDSFSIDLWQLDDFDLLKELKKLHVKSISYWAPANIGPYSQSILIPQNQLLLLSGQIGLIPNLMELPNTLIDEISLTLENVFHVFEVSIGAPTLWSSVDVTKDRKITFENGILFLGIVYGTTEESVNFCSKKFTEKFGGVSIPVIISDLPKFANVEVHPFGLITAGEQTLHIRSYSYLSFDIIEVTSSISHEIIAVVASSDRIEYVDKLLENNKNLPCIKVLVDASKVSEHESIANLQNNDLPVMFCRLPSCALQVLFLNLNYQETEVVCIQN